MHARKHHFLITAVLVAGCFALASCSDDDEPLKPIDQDIPLEVFEAADGVFGLILAVMDDDVPPISGISISPQEIPDEFIDGFQLQIICSSMDPDPPTGPLVNGTITLTTRIVQSTKRLEIAGGLVLRERTSGTTIQTMFINGLATWLSGGPEDSEPDSITGTFTVDGVVYDLAAIFEQME